MDHKEDANSENLEMEEICRLLHESQYQEQSSGAATGQPFLKCPSTDESESEDEPLLGLGTAGFEKYSSLDGNHNGNGHFPSAEIAELSSENSPPDFPGLGIAKHSSLDGIYYINGKFTDVRKGKMKKFPEENEYFPGIPGLASSDDSEDEIFTDLKTIAKVSPKYHFQNKNKYKYSEQNGFNRLQYVLPTGCGSNGANSLGAQAGSYVFKNKNKYPGLGQFSGPQMGKYSSQDESDLSDVSGLRSLKYSSSDENEFSSVENSLPDEKAPFLEAGIACKFNNNILPKSDDYNDKKPQIIRRDIEKNVLQYYDPSSKEIIVSSRYACVFFMGKGDKGWKSAQCEGVFFLYESSEHPNYRLMVLNRLSHKHFYLTISRNLSVGVNKPYILLRNSSDVMYSIWFHDENDCSSVTDNLVSIVSAQIAEGQTQQKNIAKNNGGGSSVKGQLSKTNGNMVVTKQIGSFKEQTLKDLPSPSVLDFFAKASASHSAKKPSTSNPQPNPLHCADSNMPKTHYVGEIESGMSSDSGFEQQVFKLFHQKFDFSTKKSPNDDGNSKQ